MKLFLLFAMIFCHIVDDYYLQGILAKLKQKDWWDENAPAEKYKNDYKVALVMHAFSWTFMIMLPLVIYSYVHEFDDRFWVIFYPLYFIFNTFTHASIDNEKANKHTISLLDDQLIHLGQIILTYIMYLLLLC